jgi:hypothetical protein
VPIRASQCDAETLLATLLGLRDGSGDAGSRGRRERFVEDGRKGREPPGTGGMQQQAVCSNVIFGHTRVDGLGTCWLGGYWAQGLYLVLAMSRGNRVVQANKTGTSSVGGNAGLRTAKTQVVVIRR